jgi:ribosomal protein S18 acetylase RimI-like enzyme
MIYRHATVEDAEEIAKVHIAGWRFAYKGILSDAVLSSLDVAKRTADWQQRLLDENIDTFVAADGDLICGFCACGPFRDACEVRDIWELLSIYLLPAVRGNGVGKALFELAIQSARGHQATTMALWVAEKNESARGFYASRGMSTDGIPHAHAVGDGAELRRVKYSLTFM